MGHTTVCGAGMTGTYREDTVPVFLFIRAHQFRSVTLNDITQKVTFEIIIAGASLCVSLIALGISIYIWKRQFRPIVTAAIKTVKAGNVGICYNLVVLNSGVIPARNIKIIPNSSRLLEALGEDATDENQRSWLACFLPENRIDALHNNDHVSCSFGYTQGGDQGFWKYKGEIPITIKYEGWFGKKYTQQQIIKIVDSDSFTSFSWDP